MALVIQGALLAGLAVYSIAWPQVNSASFLMRTQHSVQHHQEQRQQHLEKLQALTDDELRERWSNTRLATVARSVKKEELSPEEKQELAEKVGIEQVANLLEKGRKGRQELDEKLANYLLVRSVADLGLLEEDQIRLAMLLGIKPNQVTEYNHEITSRQVQSASHSRPSRAQVRPRASHIFLIALASVAHTAEAFAGGGARAHRFGTGGVAPTMAAAGGIGTFEPENEQVRLNNLWVEKAMETHARDHSNDWEGGKIQPVRDDHMFSKAHADAMDVAAHEYRAAARRGLEPQWGRKLEHLKTNKDIEDHFFGKY